MKGTALPPSRAKYKRTTDLYVQGRELELRDGNVVFVQALNPLERQEALGDAVAARARIILALEEIDSDEMRKVRGAFFQDGRAASIDAMLSNQTGEMLARISSQVRDQPEWREKMKIVDRNAELKARDPEDVERQALQKIESEWFAEVNERFDVERDSRRVQYEAMGDEELIAELKELWAKNRGDTAAENEMKVSELWFALRCCDGTKNEDGVWDHSACDNHQLRLYETKDEVARLPEPLMDEYLTAMSLLNLTVREAKNSARLQSSSGSSLQPDVAEESTPSTPEETPSGAPGTSTPLSVTP